MPQINNKFKFYFIYFLIILFVISISEFYFWSQYGEKRDSDLRAFQWDSQTLWKLKSNFKGKAFTFPVDINAQGFRDAQDTPVKKQSDLRVITIGDSRTYGYGVEADQTFSYFLEEYLNKYNRNAQVINGGVHGFSVVQCRAHIEQLIEYSPDIIVLAPGYNDRRYIISRPPDSTDSFKQIARIRRAAEAFQISHSMFGLMYILGKQKLQNLIETPPPLNQVKLRVDSTTFKQELDKIVEYCNQNNIQLILLNLHTNPMVYGFITETVGLFKEGNEHLAIKRLEDAGHQIPNYSHTISHYYLGKMYETIGEGNKAKKAFADHRIHGSIFGETIIRLEDDYGDAMQAMAKKHQIVYIDSNQSMIGDIPYHPPDDLLIKYYLDDCHFTAQGHKEIAASLADTIMLNIQSN